MARLDLDLDFSTRFSRDSFFFGVANAPYLCEGGYNTPNGPKNSYGYLEANGTVPVSGETTRFWENYSQHVTLAASLGLTAFRMGVDWSRMKPTYELKEGAEPEWDEGAVEHYAQILGAVQDAGMQPIVTLHHFAHPAWLGPTLWLRDDAADRVVDYELTATAKLGRSMLANDGEPPLHFITFNELNLIPLIFFNRFAEDVGDETTAQNFQQAYDNILSAHIRIYDGLKELYRSEGWSEPQVGFGTASQSPYELDKLMTDVMRLRTWGVERPDIRNFLNARRDAWNSSLGELAKRQLTDQELKHYETYAKEMADAVDGAEFTKTLDALYGSKREKKIDYISANVYEPFGASRSLGDRAKAPKWWEFAVDGDIYRTMILAYNENNTDLPMYMGENSIAYQQNPGESALPRPDGWTRERYLKTYLMEMVRCMSEGVPIHGYLYWSLVDDFEWQAGFPPRLGLYNYDYATHTIQPTDGLGEPAGAIYATLISALRSGDKARIRDTFVRPVEVD